MKLLIAKDITNIDVNEDYTEKFVALVSSGYETKICFVDASPDAKKIGHEKVHHVHIPPEKRSSMPLQVFELAKYGGCTACLYFPHQAEPKQGIVDELFDPMLDENISGTYSDYTENDVLMIQSKPCVVCRRIEDHDGDPFNLHECRNIVKYIPLDLYYVNS